MRFIRSAAFSLVVLSFCALAVQADDAKVHRVGIQVDQNDPAVMNLALNNASNIIAEYRDRHEEVEVEIVAYGPGLHMLREDTSPVKDRIRHIKEASFPANVRFSACSNTKQGMEKKEGHAISVVPEATVVSSGAVRLIELQEQGWTYLRP